MTLDALSEVLKAADYMEIEPLLDLVCLKYTFLMVGMDESQVHSLVWLGSKATYTSLPKNRSCNCNVRLTLITDHLTLVHHLLFVRVAENRCRSEHCSTCRKCPQTRKSTFVRSMPGSSRDSGCLSWYRKWCLANQSVAGHASLLARKILGWVSHAEQIRLLVAISK
jgi:hypothetical protein